MRLKPLHLALLAALMAPSLFAAWDKSKPAAGTPIVSAEIRDNWTEIEKANGVSLARDPAFSIWDAGTSVAPTLYTLSGTGATIVRTGTGEADTTRQVGKYAAKVTFGSATATLCQDTIPTASFDTGLRSRAVSMGWWAKTSTASQVRIEITDGVGSTYSGYHSGSGSFSWLSATRTLDASATKLTVCFRVEAAGSAYASALAVQVGALPPDDYRPPHPALYDLTLGGYDSRDLRLSTPPRFAPGTVTTPDATAVGRIGVNVTDASNSGSGETDLHTYTIEGTPGAVLNTDGKQLRFVFVGTTTTANTKTLRFRYGTATLTFATFTTSAEPWIVEVYVWRDGASAQRIMGRQTVEANSPSVRWVAGTNSNSADQTAKISGQSSNSSEITCRASSVEVVG